MPNSQPVQIYRYPSQPKSGGARPGNEGIRLTERDLAILHELLSARYLTTPQIQALFWHTGRSDQGRRTACQRRLLQLTRGKLIRRIEVPVTRSEAPKPYIYTLDRRGAEILVAELGIEPKDVDWKPKSREENYPFLEHILRCNDIRIALTLACEQQQVDLISFVHDRELKSQGMKDTVTLTSPDGLKQERAAVVPDAYFALQAGPRLAHFFVELDLGTVTIAPSAWEKRGWARKVRAYLAYHTSGLFQERYEGKAFRVLCVTTGEERLHNLKAVTQKEDGDWMFRFTTLEKLTAEAFLTQPIWVTAEDETAVAILE